MAGMFDLTPESVPAINMQQDTAQAMQLAQLPAGRGPVYAGALAGNMLGRGAAGALGYQDPLALHAERLHAAMRDTESSGPSYDQDPYGYLNRASKNLIKYQLYDQAMTAADKAKEVAASQQAAAQTRAANLTTDQKQQAQSRVTDIARRFVDQNGNYDWRKATAVMMADGNPEVRSAGQNSAKEYQAIEIGKIIPIGPGQRPFNSETKQYVDTGNGEYQAVSFPGEAEPETKFRWLSDLAQIAKQRPLSNREQVTAAQAYADYSKMQAGMTGIVNRGIDRRLNPANWGDGYPGQVPATPNAPMPGSVTTPGSPGASNNQYGVPGRTAPSAVTLPSGITQEAAGRYQGAAGETALDADVAKFSEHVRNQKIPQADISMREVTDVLSKYKDNPDDLPGVGYLKNTQDGTVVGTVARLFMTEEGKDVKAKIQNAIAQVMKSDIGATQTIQEARRELTRFLYSPTSSARDLFNGWRDFTNSYNAEKANIIAGTPPEALARYEKQRGSAMSRGYKSSSVLDLSPVPTVDIKPPTRGPVQQGFDKAGGAPSTSAPMEDKLPSGARVLKPGERYMDRTGERTATGGEVQTMGSDGQIYTFPNRGIYQRWTNIENGKPSQ